MSDNNVIQQFERASSSIHTGGDGSASSAEPLSARRGREARYAQAYQALVHAGLKPQIRAKYRWGVK